MSPLFSARAIRSVSTTSVSPFHHFRPEACPKIKRFAESKGAKFTMMDKVDVNGLDAHPVYHYLKKVAGPVSPLRFTIRARRFRHVAVPRC